MDRRKRVTLLSNCFAAFNSMHTRTKNPRPFLAANANVSLLPAPSRSGLVSSFSTNQHLPSILK